MQLVTQEETENAGDNALAYIFVFAEKYYTLLAADSRGEIQQRMSIEQSVLLAFVTLDNEVSNGGFIQLIENGYGPYIFDNPLSDYLREWGAEAVAAIIDVARLTYHDKKVILEREKTLEEFTKLYAEHKEFEEVEHQFYSVIGGERAKIKEYMQAHFEQFAELAEKA